MSVGLNFLNCLLFIDFRFDPWLEYVGNKKLDVGNSLGEVDSPPVVDLQFRRHGDLMLSGTQCPQRADSHTESNSSYFITFSNCLK